MNTNGVSSCGADVSTCSDSPGRGTVESLAADNDAFVEEFIEAFTKMIEKVGENLCFSIFFCVMRLPCNVRIFGPVNEFMFLLSQFSGTK